MQRLEVRLPDEHAQILDDYRKRTGASKTGAILMLISVLKDEELMGIIGKRFD